MNGIKINKLRVEGDKYRRTLEFDDGINIISGDIYSGKSLVLRLIDYIFGKREINLNVQKALDKWCDKVFLEVMINNKVYTLRRNLKKQKTKFYIYYCNLNLISEYTPKVLEKKEYSLLLTELLNIPKYKLLKYKKRSEDRELESIGLRDVFRFVYIDQHDLGTHNFLKRNEKDKFRKNKYTFDILMNLVEEDVDGVKEELASIINNINDNNKIILGLKSFLKEGKLEDEESIKSERNDLDMQINEYINQKREIINKIKDNKPIESPIYNKLLKDRNINIKLEQEIDEKISDISLELLSREELLNSYKQELKEIDATKEINYKLEVINHIVKCPLCNSEVKELMKSKSELSIFEDIEKELTNKVKMLDGLIGALREKKSNLYNDKVHYKNKIEKLTTILEKYNTNYSPQLKYINELEMLNNLIAKGNYELQKYQESLKVHNKIKEKEEENIEKEKTRNKLQEKVDNLIVDNGYKKQLIKELNKNYLLLLNKLGYNINPEDTYIREDNYIPYYNQANVYEHDSGGVLVCIQIAYLGAIIMTANQYNGAKHPNILMLDTIGKYLGSYKEIYVSDNEQVEVMDEQTYRELYGILKMISTYSQIIIVDNTPPIEEGKNIKYIFKNKSKSREAISEYGLIDLTKNEFAL